MDQDSVQYKDWKIKHDDGNYQINHHGSSEKMQDSARVEMFGSNLTERKLKYTTFVGDDDSSSYCKVKEAMEEKYGDKYTVVKEECVGHVQKTYNSITKVQERYGGQKAC